MDNESIRNLVMLELVQPSPYEGNRIIPEDEGRALYERYKSGSRDWNYVFEPIKDEKTRQRFIDLYKELDKK